MREEFGDQVKEFDDQTRKDADTGVNETKGVIELDDAELEGIAGGSICKYLM